MHILNIADIELVEGDRNYVKIHGRARAVSRPQHPAAGGGLIVQPTHAAHQPLLPHQRAIYIRELSRTPRGDFIFVLACGTTVTSSEGFRDKVRAHLENMKLGAK